MFWENVTNHAQNLNSNPELINDYNILPITTNLPIITILLMKILNKIQPYSIIIVILMVTQDPIMQILTTTFLIE